MRNKIVLSALTIVLAAAMIVGGTMAWFTDEATGGETTFTAGTVRIEAGQVITVPDGDNHTWVEGQIFPKWVVGRRQGKRKNGTSVPNTRSNPDSVLKLDDQFFSLGFGGEIIVEFAHIIKPEDTIVLVVEETHGNYPEEKAKVLVSMDNVLFEELGTATNTTNNGNKKYNEFVMTDILPYARYIKIVDISDPEIFTDATADGFDVNAIYVNAAYKDRDHNWNPGDTSIRRYDIKNTGTKDINVRGSFTGGWYIYDEATYSWVPWTPNPNLNVVTITATGDWVQEGSYFYYMPGLAGTYENEEGEETTLILNINIDGENTDNQYQGKRYILSAEFEAIQASNHAAYHHWGTELFGSPEEL